MNYLDKGKLYAEASLNACRDAKGPDYLGFLLGASGLYALNAALSKGKKLNQMQSKFCLNNCVK